MKNLILITFILGCLLVPHHKAQASLNLKCKANGIPFFAPTEGAAVVAGWLFQECEDKAGNKYGLDFIGYGAGLEMSVDSYTVVSCPLVNKKRILAGKSLKVFGPKISAGLVGGFHLGLGANARGVVCTLAGFNFNSYGAAALVGEMEIYYTGDVK